MIFLAVLTFLVFICLIIFVRRYNLSTPHIDSESLDRYVNDELSDEEFNEFLSKNSEHLLRCYECQRYINLRLRIKDKLQL